MIKTCILFLFYFLPAFSCLCGQKISDSTLTADEVIIRLYSLVTFEAGTTPDWGSVKSLFLPDAVIVLRTARESTTVFTVEGFVNDFISFIEQAEAEKTGFVEKIIRMKALVFGDIASVWVLYEASIPGSERPPQQGVDFFSLIKKEGRWVIVSVTNEIPTPERLLPEIFEN